jgi:hypothetical protein
MERGLEHQGKYSYDTIYNDRVLKHKDISIYHVHGYLPRNGKILLEHSKSVVLSEYKYNYLFNNPLSWQVSCQLTRFRENVCLLIGLSISDPSLRRILEYVKQSNQNAVHYAIFSKQSAKYTSNFNDIVAVNKHFERMGIRILWVDNYSDIPRLIDSI